MAEKKKGGLKELSPITIYKNLPKTNCKECGQENCMAFATKIVNREVDLDACKPLLKPENAKQYALLSELLKPAVKEVTIGIGDKAKKIGGKLVMYRHEFTYKNPTAIAIDVTDEMPESEVVSRVQKTDNFSYEYIGNTLKLDLIAVRSTSENADKFKACVKKVSETTQLPLILVALNPAIAEAGLMAAPKARPLLYAATTTNWKEMAELAIMYDAPLVASAPNDLNALISLAKTLQEYGVKDIVLDPGTFANDGLADTLNNFTMLRRAATKGGEELAGLPLIGIPMVAWANKGDLADDLVKWRESYLASMLITRFADAIILHSNDGWSLLPTVVLRQNIYTDPRKPVAVEPGLKVFGTPDENSPVMFTSNFALTFYTVASDIESSKTNAYLIVVDAEGAAIDAGVAGRKLTAEKIADAIKASGIENKVKHRKIISPGKASRISGEIEELSGWKVLVGPRDSSEIAKYVIDKWQP
ncbi:acetyl-CoA decarbonylase/synthase complex subunit gamma [Candidatus Bathycorpusculum sp.]|uniref:acetyl-CoA decarbonylase/synthase complex subunit gamma n=1 Tax=Candidatus Bathycorpusculum sp. TaxID=2994959 RepID=UPI002839F66A|nr:acetyl-CoA decarbonylase/synthase complex subunit gamma [Candidatus Termitimicrobium sp.]